MAKPDVTANSPIAGSIAWGAFTIQYMGVGYAIPAGSTAERWVWWRYNTGGATTTLEAGAAIPTDLKDDDLVLLANKNGNPLRVQSSSLVDGELLVDGTIFAPALAVDSVTSQAIKAGEVTADKVGADVMVVNNVFAKDGIQVQVPGGLAGIRLDEFGFLQLDSTGAARVNFPSDPQQPNLVRSELITEGITAQGRVALRGIDNEVSRNSAIVLQTGTTPPANSPSIATGLQIAKTGAPNYTGVGYVPHLCRDSGASWRILQNTTVYNLTDAGALTTAGTIAGLPAGMVVATNGGFCKIGTTYYFIGLATLNQVYNVPHLVWMDSSFQYGGSFPLPTDGNFTSRLQALATDGTDLYSMAYNSNANQSKVYRISASTGSVLSSVVLDTAFGAVSTTKLMVGSFDYGSFRYIVSNTVNPTTFNASGVSQANEGWTGNGSLESWGWDGTRFFTLTGGTLYRASTNKTTRTLYAAFTWYDSDAGGGGNFETPASPIISFTQPARYAVAITTPPPADDGTNTAPDSARFYVGLSAATLKLQTLPSPYVLNSFLLSATYLDPNPSAGTAIPTVNTFPDGTAALIRSKAGLLVLRGDSTIDVPDPLLPVHAAPKRYVDVGGQKTHTRRTSTADLAFVGSPAVANLEFPGVVDASSEFTYSTGTRGTTILAAGLYIVSSSVSITEGTPGNIRELNVRRNNVNIARASMVSVGAAYMNLSTSTQLRLAVNDVITVQLYKEGAANVSALSGQCFLSLTRIGA